VAAAAIAALMCVSAPWQMNRLARHRHAAEMALAAGQLPAAIESARSMRLGPPALPAAARYEARWLVQMGQTDEALARVAEARTGGTRLALLANTEMEICRIGLTQKPGPAWATRLREAAGRVVTHEPHSTQAHLRAAQAAQAAGDRATAAAWLRRALELDAQGYLDPIAQMPADRRRELEKALQALETDSPPAPKP